MKKFQTGFGAIGLIVVVLIIGALAGICWKVYSYKSQPASKNTPLIANSSTSKLETLPLGQSVNKVYIDVLVSQSGRDLNGESLVYATINYAQILAITITDYTKRVGKLPELSEIPQMEEVARKVKDGDAFYPQALKDGKFVLGDGLPAEKEYAYLPGYTCDRQRASRLAIKKSSVKIDFVILAKLEDGYACAGKFN